eukprot:m.93814 g.93814  ORF g.93814 m.93814 type:complete len:217 (-) comp15103_c0_seq1:74-724(-)
MQRLGRNGKNLLFFFFWVMRATFYHSTCSESSFLALSAVLCSAGPGVFSWLRQCTNSTDQPTGFLVFRQLANVLTVTYGVFVVIHLANFNEKHSNTLRYIAFAAVWVCQLRDDYWMDETKYTLYAVVGFVVVAGVKLIAEDGPLPWRTTHTFRGFAALCMAGVCFRISLADEYDKYRLWHGLAQVFVGVALWFFWQCIPQDFGKKYDFLPGGLKPL